MGPQTFFFSYARSDSDFVLRLARDLRKAGADLWLDQLDIKSGTRWDLSIETALKDTSKMLVILSPTSITSTNVMDEVSFALEESKTVIPVLYKHCEIPFRLRRLQHADFTSNYDDALENLILALILGKTTSIADEVLAPEPALVVIQESDKAEKIKKTGKKELRTRTVSGKLKKERKIRQESEPVEIDSGLKSILRPSTLFQKKYKKPVIISGAMLVLLVTVGMVISGTIGNGNISVTEQISANTVDNSAEIQAWNVALALNSIDGFKTYAANYPEGLHIKDAQDRIKSSEEATINEDREWSAARANNTVASYQKYLSLYPTGRYFSQAEWQISTLKEVKKPSINSEVSIAKPEVKQKQSFVEAQKPVEAEIQIPAQSEIQIPAQSEIQKPVEAEIKNSVAIAEKKIDITGIWLTDEGQEWKLVRTGDSLEITWFYEKKASIQAKTIIIENYFQFKIRERNGREIPGEFSIINEKTLQGRIGKFNDLKVTRK